MNAIKDTVRVVLGSKTSSKDKLNYLHKICTDQRTKKLNQASFPQIVSERQKLYTQVSEWIYRQQIVRGTAAMEIAADILASMSLYPTEITGWKNCWVFLLLTKIRSHTEEASQSKNAEIAIHSVVSDSLLLSGLSAGFLSYFSDIAFLILQQEERCALEQIENIIEKDQDIPDEYADDFLKLGLNLSARLKRKTDFIYLKKARISTLIGCSRMDDAEKELEDWDTILPSDSDFQMFRKCLSNSVAGE